MNRTQREPGKGQTSTGSEDNASSILGNHEDNSGVKSPYEGEGPFEAGKIQNAANHYLGRGWNPTPCKPSTKRPRLKEWQERKVDAKEFKDPDPVTNTEGDSLGLVLGRMSNGLVCADLDGVDLEIADYLLPDTDLVDGRGGNPSSHRFYQVPDEQRKVSFNHPDKGRGKIVELLGDGGQVIVPPSTHPSGSLRTWERYGKPTEVNGAELVAIFGRIAAYQILRDLWPDGGRHDLSLPLAGGLLRAGIEAEEVKWLLKYLNRDTVRNEDEIDNIVDSTARKLDEDDAHVTGWPTLARELGGKATQKWMDTVLDWLGVVDVDLDDPRVRVYIKPSHTSHRLGKQAWTLLEEANDPPILFRRANRLLRVRPSEEEQGVFAEVLSYDGFKYQLSELLCFVKADDGKPRPMDPPRGAVLDMLQHPNPPVPVLTRVVGVPVFAPDGSLQTEPGYHAAAKVYYQPDPGLDVPPIPENPTDDEVRSARDLLLEMLQDFPFASEADRTHAVALALLPFARDLVAGTTPLHLVEASREGTGKGLLLQVLTSIFEGGGGAAGRPLSESEEEVRKTILAALLESRAFILFDNIGHTVDSSSLAAVLTTSLYEDRQLGVSETRRVKVRSVFAGSGNNVATSNEIARRFVRCRIQSDDERPDLRMDYAIPNLAGWAARNRGRLVAACLTLIQSWVARGMERSSHRLGNYVEWAGVMGGILQGAGFSNFLGNVVEFREEAAGQGVAWKTLVTAWKETFGTNTITASQLSPLAENAGVEHRGQPVASTQDLGLALKSQVGNVYEEHRIERAPPPRGSSKAYKLVKVTPRKQHLTLFGDQNP